MIGFMEDRSGIRMPIVLETDSSALKGIAIWENLTCWVQDLVERTWSDVRNVDGATNTAHVLTLYFSPQTRTDLECRMSVAFDRGRSTSVLQHRCKVAHHWTVVTEEL